MERKRYEDQNPWISFEFKVQMDTLWALLGEAYSKTQHLVGTPLPPGFARELASVYLRRGALASTAIEGNTLSLDELNKIMDEGHKLPPSQEYLEREVANVLSALDVVCKTAKPGAFLLSPEWIMRQNATVLDGLDVDDHVEPGEYTTKQLVVGAYRAAPPQDVPYLVDRLCRWLNEEYISRANAPGTPEDQRFYLAFLAAALGHLYVAWIHPFGDGNGRTARILQAAVLANSGVGISEPPVRLLQPNPDAVLPRAGRRLGTGGRRRIHTVQRPGVRRSVARADRRDPEVPAPYRMAELRS